MERHASSHQHEAPRISHRQRAATRQWVELWQRVAGWGAIYAQTDSLTAELVKYMENAFLATKKIFCDEFYDLAQHLGVDYNELKELWLLDGRVGRAMTLVHPQNRGFGGRCLPKDVSALVHLAASRGLQSPLFETILGINDRVRGCAPIESEASELSPVRIESALERATAAT